MNKKAQFYLVAAIIIVGVIIGLATITNYIVVKKEPVKFYDLSEEISEESYRTSEYIIIDENINEEYIMGDFTNITARYIERDVDNFAVFYGNENEATLEFFTKNETGDISAIIGGEKFMVSGRKDFISNQQPVPTPGKKGVEITLLDEEYNFKLKKGQNFIFIITKKTEEETHISGTEAE